MKQDTEQLQCLDRHKGDCQGAVEMRHSMSPTGRSFPRCDKHLEDRLEVQDKYREYQSDTPPSWFDPTYAGERWDEDY